MTIDDIEDTTTMLLLLLLLFAPIIADSLRLPIDSATIRGYATIDCSTTSCRISFVFDHAPPADVFWTVKLAVSLDCASMKNNIPSLFERKLITDTGPISASLADLYGHSIVLTGTDDNVPIACTNIIDESARIYAADYFHSINSDRLDGSVHLLLLVDRIRLIANLQRSNAPSIRLNWAFADDDGESSTDCLNNDHHHSPQSSNRSQLVTTFDNHRVSSTISIDTQQTNVSLIHSLLLLFDDHKLVGCARLKPVINQSAIAGTIQFDQRSPFHATTANRDTIRICDNNQQAIRGIATNSTSTFAYPSIGLFGANSSILQDITDGSSTNCSQLLPSHPAPYAIAHFFYPIVGDLVFVGIDNGGTVMVGDLQHAFDSTDSYANVTIRSGGASLGAGSLADLLCKRLDVDDNSANMYRLTVPIRIGAYNRSNRIRFRQSMPDFVLPSALNRIVIVDIGWTRVCANLTIISDHNGYVVRMRRYSPVRAPTVVQIDIAEMPYAPQSIIRIDQSSAIKLTEYNLSVYDRPIDMSFTTGPPCGQMTIGAEWKTGSALLQALILRGDSEIIYDRRLVSEVGFLGKTLVMSSATDLMCGTVEMATEEKGKVIATAVFSADDGPFNGFIQFIQSDNNQLLGNAPTLVIYQLSLTTTDDVYRHRDTESIDWSIVDGDDDACTRLLIYNPFQSQTKSDQMNHSCTANVRLCPIGELSPLRTASLAIDARRSLIVDHLPLSGIFSVINRSIRLRSTTNASRSVQCAKIEPTVEWEFQFATDANRSRQYVQDELVGRFEQLQSRQIGVSYDRTTLGNVCSVYTITIRGTQSQIDNARLLYDVNRNRFKNDPDDGDRCQTVGKNDAASMVINTGIIIHLLILYIGTVAII